MADVPLDLVLLAEVWECPRTDEFTEHPGMLFTEIVEREFRKPDGLSIYYRLPNKIERERLRPVDCEINWIGPPGATGYQPCAEPACANPLRPQQRYLDLAIAREDWDRIWDEVMDSLGFTAECPPSNINGSTAPSSEDTCSNPLPITEDRAAPNNPKPKKSRFRNLARVQRFIDSLPEGHLRRSDGALFERFIKWFKEEYEQPLPGDTRKLKANFIRILKERRVNSAP